MSGWGYTNTPGVEFGLQPGQELFAERLGIVFVKQQFDTLMSAIPHPLGGHYADEFASAGPARAAFVALDEALPKDYCSSARTASDQSRAARCCACRQRCRILFDALLSLTDKLRRARLRRPDNLRRLLLCCSEQGVRLLPGALNTLLPDFLNRPSRFSTGKRVAFIILPAFNVEIVKQPPARQ